MKKSTMKLMAGMTTLAIMLTACSGGGDSSNGGGGGAANVNAGSEDFVYTGEGPITDAEGATVSVLAMNSYYTTVDMKQAPIVLKVQEDANITVDWTLIDPTNYEDAVSPMMAAGTDLPDVVLLPDMDPNMIYLSSGMFVALDEYFDEMPNFVKWLDENPVAKASLTAQDGHIYYVPHTVVTHNYQPQLMYNMKWLSDSGMDVPETLDDFVELLRYYRDNDMNGDGDTTDEVPMSITADFLPYIFGPAFGLGWDSTTGFYVDDDGVVQYAYYDDVNYKAYLEFLNGLYQEGLLEMEFTTLTRDQITERFANDRTGVTFDYSWQQSTLYSVQLPYYDGTPETGVVAQRPLGGDHEAFYVGRNPLSGIFGVTSKSDNVLLAVRFLDFAMSEANQEMYVWGIEGESYTVQADGSYEYTEQAADGEWLQALGINPSVVLPAHQSVEATDALLTDWHVEADKAQEKWIREPFPFIYSTVEEADFIAQYLVDIETYAEEMNVAFITGTTPLDNFDSYMQGLRNMNVEELIEIKTAQYARYTEAMG